MKNIIKIITVFTAILMLASCSGKNLNNSQTITNPETEWEEKTTEITATPEPMAEKVLSSKKISHSFGVAKNGEANIISKDAQSFFEKNNFNAFCLDTKSQEKVLYLTFDCGYENGYTEKILDILKEKNVSAAFFCTLPQVKENPELISRMIDEGHIVGNHSTTHPSFAEISVEQMESEVNEMNDYLKSEFNYSEPYFRFPKGEYNEVALKKLGDMGYTCVFWSLAYSDWDLKNQKGVDYAFQTVTSRLHPGAVILLHSVSPDNANALAKIIDEAQNQGYKFFSLRDYPKN